MTDLPPFDAIVEKLTRLDHENPNVPLHSLFVDAASEFRAEGFHCTTDDLISVATRELISARRERKI